MKEEYQVIIKGGAGNRTMYHLAHEGWTDVLLRER